MARKRQLGSLLVNPAPAETDAGPDEATLRLLAPPNASRDWWLWVCSDDVMPRGMAGMPVQCERAIAMRWERLDQLERWWLVRVRLASRAPGDERARRLLAHERRAAAWLLADWRSRRMATQWVSRHRLSFDAELETALAATRDVPLAATRGAETHRR